MKTVEAETVIVGSGIAGVLVARELARRGQHCTIIERGSFVPWEEQIRRMRWEGDAPTSAHNDESSPDGERWIYHYVYGVGGSSNHWTGTAPRFLPQDFEMRSRYGVMVDWPLSYEALLPYYRKAERAMAIAGARNELMPGAGFPLPAHPLSPQDRAVAPHLTPFIPLPQARPSRPVGARPACCGSNTCDLCPVDARFSVLNGLGSTFDRPNVRLIDETIGVKLVKARSGRSVQTLDCLTADKEPLHVHGKRFVVAANAIESPALLLRSGIETPATGRYFASKRAWVLVLRTRIPVGPGRGASRNTGAAYAYYLGGFRSRRAAALLVPVNYGHTEALLDPIVQGVLNANAGKRLRERAVASWERAILFDVSLEDEPDPANTVTLSPRRDSFGIPLNRVHKTKLQPYGERTLAYVTDDIPRRLRSLGAYDASFREKPEGSHLLGTLRMGSESDGVVDRDLRHHGFDNLFVAGSAVFPTYSATHPTLTIAALSVRLGQMLAASG